ncbi:MAG TPA: NTPase [Candidatus Binatia bacterium]|jgi:nucleoside-triphosphatase|nr:NTPase [Candidatus Binatia bacterium]
MRVFLTGNPGIGKTTLVRAVLERLDQIQCAGFYTQEKKHGGQRIGFKIVTLDGQEGTLASVGRKEPTVGKYSIHVEEFEKLVLPLLDPDTTLADLYVIDEIGKMELLSHKFRAKIIDLLARPSNLLGTIAKKGKGFVEQIKRRNDIDLIEVTRKNRDDLPKQIEQKIKQIWEGRDNL